MRLPESTYILELWRDGKLIHSVSGANPIVDEGVNRLFEVTFTGTSETQTIWPLLNS